MKKDLTKLVPKKVRRASDGAMTTVWVKVEGGATSKRSKALRLMKEYRSILSKLAADESGPNWKDAAATRIMVHTGIRIGNEASASGYVSKVDGAEKQTFGLTTLDKGHVKFVGNNVVMEFPGKKGVSQSVKVTDPKVVGLVKRLYDESNGNRLLEGVTRNTVAKYIRHRVGDYNPKDMRMARANLEALKAMTAIEKRPRPKTKTALNAEVNEVMDHVSSVLGNTRGVAKRSYVDEFLTDSFVSKRWKGR